MSAPLYFRSETSLEHETGPHPEGPGRIPAIEREMESRDWLGYERREAPRVDDGVLRAVHPPEYVDSVREMSERGGGSFDPDTVASPGTYEAALHAAGGACALVDALVAGEAPTGFCGLRPPGHHAEKARAMGFCFFNNIAIAAQHALDAHGLERVFILDWDVHHGNGTNAIFRSAPDVLFVSIHQWPLYPGTGPASDLGSGPGEGFTVNLPVPGGSGDAVWCSLAEHVGAGLIRSWSPQLVLVSAGFDAHRDDPLATCTVNEAGFAAMTASLRGAADAVGAPMGLVLEGGYDLGALAHSMAALMPVLIDGGPAVDLAVHPLASEARARLAPWWPDL
jgi:acetoin utilization deacetylase AcuC-like enzyme